VQEELERVAKIEEEADKIKLARRRGNWQEEQKRHARRETQEGA